MMKSLKYITHIRKPLAFARACCVLTCFVLNTRSVIAQGSATIKDNDLDNSKNLSIGGNIFGVDVYDQNLNMFLEGKFAYRLKKEYGWVRGNFRKAFADRMDEVVESSTSQDALPANGTQSLKTYGVNLGFNFIRKEEFKIAKATFFGGMKSKSVKLPIKSLRLYGIHVGYEYFRTVLAQGSTTSYSGTIVEKFPTDTVVTATNATPMLTMKMISIGIHREFVEHYEILVSNEGMARVYKNRSISTVYADFIIATSMKLDDILVPLNSKGPNSANQNNIISGSNDPYNFYRVDINNSYTKIPIGGRIGWEQTTLGPVGLIVGVECGFRPCYANPADNLFITFKIGMSFNMKVK